MSSPPLPNASPQRRLVLGLGLTQMLGWGSSYYLPATLAGPMARDLGLGTATVFAAFSWALIVCALAGPWAGRALDRWGGRPVMACASMGFALGLALLSQAQGPVSLFLAWTLIGLAMASGLYETAFSTLVQFYGAGARRSITGITLMGGLASTLSWPLTAWLEITWDWRVACLAWAGMHLLLCLPIHLRLRPGPMPASVGSTPETAPTPAWSSEGLPEAQRGRAAVLLSTIFGLTWFISTAMAAHLPALLLAQGLPLATALLLGSLIGPAQVAGRLAEYGLLRHLHPLLSARIAGALHPLGALLFLGLGTPVGAVFTLLHGAGNGVLTIAQGTLPLALFGTQGYGLRQGLLMVPARFAQAAAPFLFGLALEHAGAQALWLSCGLGLCCVVALWLLPSPARAGAAR